MKGKGSKRFTIVQHFLLSVKLEAVSKLEKVFFGEVDYRPAGEEIGCMLCANSLNCSGGCLQPHY